MMEVETHEYGLDLHTCPAELCVDNGAMIAWNGWELKQAEQDVCVRERVLEGHKKSAAWQLPDRPPDHVEKVPRQEAQ